MSSRGGFSLVEVTVALVVFEVGILGVLAMTLQAQRRSLQPQGWNQRPGRWSGWPTHFHSRVGVGPARLKLNRGCSAGRVRRTGSSPSRSKVAPAPVGPWA